MASCMVGAGEEGNFMYGRPYTHRYLKVEP